MAGSSPYGAYQGFSPLRGDFLKPPALRVVLDWISLDNYTANKRRGFGCPAFIMSARLSVLESDHIPLYSVPGNVHFI